MCPHSTEESSLDRSVVTRRRAFSRSRFARSLAVASLDLSRSLTRSHGHVEFSDSSKANWHSRVDPPHDSQLLRSLSRGHSTCYSCGHSTRTLTVTRLALLRSLDSHSCGHSTRTLAVTRLALFAVTRLTPLQSLDSLSRSHSARIALSQSLRLLASLEHDVIPRRHSLDSISSYSAHIDLSQSLRSRSPRGVDVSTQQQGLAEAYPYLLYPSWLHDESSRKQSTRTHTVIRRRSISRSRSYLSRGHSTRSFSRHLTDESSFDRRVLTRPFCRHFDRRVLTRPTSPHSTVLSSLRPKSHRLHPVQAQHETFP
ncbi:hypothetical protein Bca4012_077328 [Brassica carinata]